MQAVEWEACAENYPCAGKQEQLPPGRVFVAQIHCSDGEEEVEFGIAGGTYSGLALRLQNPTIIGNPVLSNRPQAILQLNK